MILTGGGLRSLVATALAAEEVRKQQLVLLHVVDGRENAPIRLDYVHRQAQTFEIRRVTELDLPHLFGHGYGKQPDGRPIGPLALPQMLLAAMAQARLQQIERIVWPKCCNAEPRAVATATEQALLCSHLGDLEAKAMPRIQTPLLELTDQQVIELGEQLGVPWRASWSCLLDGAIPCRTCAGCRQRKAAFEAAGVVDPMEKNSHAEH